VYTCRPILSAAATRVADTSILSSESTYCQRNGERQVHTTQESKKSGERRGQKGKGQQGVIDHLEQ